MLMTKYLKLFLIRVVENVLFTFLFFLLKVKLMQSKKFDDNEKDICCQCALKEECKAYYEDIEADIEEGSNLIIVKQCKKFESV